MRKPRAIIAAALFFCAALATNATAQDGAQTISESIAGRALVTVAIHPPEESDTPIRQIVAEVAATPAQRRKGLSGRHELAADRGMIFVLDATSPRACFWMKDTHIPLAAIFTDKDGNVIHIAEMQPRDLTTHCAGSPQTPARIVLETNLPAPKAGRLEILR